jgi:hypothetical protein
MSAYEKLCMTHHLIKVGFRVELYILQCVNSNANLSFEILRIVCYSLGTFCFCFGYMS